MRVCVRFHTPFPFVARITCSTHCRLYPRLMSGKLFFPYNINTCACALGANFVHREGISSSSIGFPHEWWSLYRQPSDCTCTAVIIVLWWLTWYEHACECVHLLYLRLTSAPSRRRERRRRCRRRPLGTASPPTHTHTHTVKGLNDLICCGPVASSHKGVCAMLYDERLVRINELGSHSMADGRAATAMKLPSWTQGLIKRC